MSKYKKYYNAMKEINCVIKNLAHIYLCKNCEKLYDIQSLTSDLSSSFYEIEDLLEIVEDDNDVIYDLCNAVENIISSQLKNKISKMKKVCKHCKYFDPNTLSLCSLKKVYIINLVRDHAGDDLIKIIKEKIINIPKECLLKLEHVILTGSKNELL